LIALGRFLPRSPLDEQTYDLIRSSRYACWSSKRSRDAYCRVKMAEDRSSIASGNAEMRRGGLQFSACDCSAGRCLQTTRGCNSGYVLAYQLGDGVSNRLEAIHLHAAVDQVPLTSPSDFLSRTKSLWRLFYEGKRDALETR
jgi:hypothetical protein